MEWLFIGWILIILFMLFVYVRKYLNYDIKDREFTVVPPVVGKVNTKSKWILGYIRKLDNDFDKLDKSRYSIIKQYDKYIVVLHNNWDIIEDTFDNLEDAKLAILRELSIKEDV